LITGIFFCFDHKHEKMDRDALLSAGAGFDLHADDTRAAPMDESNSSDEASSPQERLVINSSASMAAQLMGSSSSDEAEDGGEGMRSSLAMAGLTLGTLEQDEEICRDDEDDFIDDEDDDDLHDYASDRRRQARDGSEAEEADEHDLDVLRELPEDWDTVQTEMSPYEGFQEYCLPRLKAIAQFVHHSSRTSPLWGGRFAAIFVQAPSALGADEGEEHILAAVNACRMTTKPRMYAIARAWQKSLTRPMCSSGYARPGTVVAADIEQLVRDFTLRPKSKQKAGGKDTNIKVYRELIKTTHEMLKGFKIVHAIVTSVHSNGKLTSHSYGYSSKYPIINLLNAALIAHSPSTLQATLKEMRRQSPGHRHSHSDPLDRILEEMLEPTI
jgi:hypothetical protein